MHHTPAILLRKTRLTESSLILAWLTPDFGRIKTVAKGVLRPKNRLAGVLDLFHLCELHFQNARSSDLHTLRDAQLQNSFPSLRPDYSKILLAAYAVELIEKSSEPETPVPELFDLLHRLLSYLDREKPSLRALLHLESELVRLLGIHSPSIPPEAALRKHLHFLPANRAELLARLAGKSP